MWARHPCTVCAVTCGLLTDKASLRRVAHQSPVTFGVTSEPFNPWCKDRLGPVTREKKKKKKKDEWSTPTPFFFFSVTLEPRVE